MIDRHASLPFAINVSLERTPLPKLEHQQVGLSNPSPHRQRTISSGHDQMTFKISDDFMILCVCGFTVSPFWLYRVPIRVPILDLRSL